MIKKGYTVETWNSQHGTVVEVVGAKLNVQFDDGRRFCSLGDIVSFKEPDDKFAKAKKRLAEFKQSSIPKQATFVDDETIKKWRDMAEEREMETSYKGFEIGDQVTVKVTEELYDDMGEVNPGTIGTIRAFPPKVTILKADKPKHDGFDTFALVVFDNNNTRAGVDISNLELVTKYKSFASKFVVKPTKVAMKLLTQEILNKIPPLRSQEDKGDEAIAYVKFFTPTSDWTWYATEYDPVNREFFGLVQGFEEELGYFSLDELENVKGPMGLGVERDKWFKPTPLKDLKGKTASVDKMAPGKVDESKWDEAKAAIKKSTGKTIEDFGDSEWAQVNKVYQNMGGKFKSKSSLKVANYQLNVVSPEEDKENYIKVVTEKYNKRFKSQEQFEQQIDTISMDIAAELGAKYDRKGDTLVFDFSGVLKDPMEVLEKQPKTPIDKAMSIMSEGLKTEGVYSPELISKVETLIKEKTMDKVAGHPNESFKAKYALGDIFVPSDGSDDSNQITIVGMTESAYVVEQRPIGDRKPDKDDKTYGIRFEMKFSEIEGNKELKKFAGSDRLIHYTIDVQPFQVYPGATITPSEWNIKQMGSPTPENIKKFVDVYNAALEPDGVNSHIGRKGAIYGGVVTDQFKKEKVAEWKDDSIIQTYKNKPTFEVSESRLASKLEKLSDTTGNEFGKLFEDVAVNIGQATELWDKINKLGAGLTFETGVSEENKKTLDSDLQKLIDTLNVVVSSSKDLKETVSPAPETTASKFTKEKIASLMKKAERLGEYEFDVHGGENWTIEAGEDGKKKIVRRHV